MPVLSVPDMSCQKCVGRIERVIRDLDDQASIHADLQQKTILINSSKSIEQIIRELDDAGYPASITQD